MCRKPFFTAAITAMVLTVAMACAWSPQASERPPVRDTFTGVQTLVDSIPQRIEFAGGNVVIYNYCDPDNRLLGADKKLKFLSYNIADGGTHTPNSQAGIKELLKKTDFDVLALQEVDLRYGRSGRERDFSDEIARENHLCGVFVAGADWSKYSAVWPYLGLQGVTVLSRFPVIDHRAIKLPEPGHYFWEKGGDHGEQRSAVEVTIQPDGKTPIHIIGTHLSVPDSDRIREIQALKHEFVNRVGSHTLLMGDLNMDPWSPEMTLLNRPSKPGKYIGFRDAGQLLPTPAVVNTYPNEKPWTQIDHVMFEGDWNVQSQRSWISGWSDHNPLLVEAEFR